MQVNKLWKAPDFWEWIKKNVPPSMVAREYACGYGSYYGIYQRGTAPLTGIFGYGDPIACVDEFERKVNLYSPEYFSDFEDLLRRFEAVSKQGTTLNYWCSPKDEAAA